MKKRMLCLVLVALLLTGCAGPATPNSTTTAPAATGQTSGIDFTTGNLGNVNLTVMGDASPMPGFDAQSKYACMAFSAFQETDTFYIGNCMGASARLHYYDKVSGISDYLCADPACEHNSADCGAYVNGGASVFWYNGQRWWIGNDGQTYTLRRSDLSGLNQEKVKRLDWQNVILAYQPQQYAIHRGNLFFYGNRTIVEGVEEKTRMVLMASPLDGSEEFAALFDMTVERGYCSMHFAGTKVFFEVVFTNNKDDPAYTDHAIYSYDLATNTYATVYSGPPTNAGWTSWVTEAGKVYSCISGLEAQETSLWKLEEGSWTKVAAWPAENIIETLVLDGIVAAYPYKDGTRGLEIRDFEGKLIASQDSLFPSQLPGFVKDPNSYAVATLGGDREKLILHLSCTKQNVVVQLALQDSCKLTILWSEEE